MSVLLVLPTTPLRSQESFQHHFFSTSSSTEVAIQIDKQVIGQINRSLHPPTCFALVLTCPLKLAQLSFKANYHWKQVFFQKTMTGYVVDETAINMFSSSCSLQPIYFKELVRGGGERVICWICINCL